MTTIAVSRQTLIDQLNERIRQQCIELDLAYERIAELKNRTHPEGWDAPIETYEQVQRYIDQLEHQLRAKDFELGVSQERCIAAQSLADERRIILCEAEIHVIRADQKIERQNKRIRRVEHELTNQRNRNAILREEILGGSIARYRLEGSCRAAWFVAGVFILICVLLAVGLFCKGVLS
jgi:chromosome segregation ATPase